MDVAPGEAPDAKEQVLAALGEQEQPIGRAKSATAWAASRTAVRRHEVARTATRTCWQT